MDTSRTDDAAVSGGDAVRRARTLAVRRAEDLGRPELADDAALVASELATNAVLHGGGCRAVEVTAVPEGLRIEVHDRSRLPPMLGRPPDGSLTGRGVQLVAAVASRWGVEPAADGKVVWAEVTGQGRPVAEALSETDLLALWDDRIAPRDQLRFHVELGDVPTDLLLAAKAHVDNLVREFALASAGAESGATADVPPRLAYLLQAVVERFAEARQAIKHQALDAARRGAPRARISLDLPAAAAAAAEEYADALDEVDAYCRAKRLLTLETPPQHHIFRRWYIDGLVAQLRAAAVGAPRPPVQPFEQRLLDEVDRLAGAQRAFERAARLYEVAAALAKADTPEAVAEVVLNEGVAALGASGGGVFLATDDDTLALPGAVGYDDALVDRLRNESRDAELPAAVALRTGEAVWIESRDERDRRFPELVGLEAGTLSLCAVPLEIQGRQLGALRFSFREARLFDDDERRFVLALAGQTAQALARAQLQQARLDMSRRLQRSLLPPSLPEIPGVDVHAIYHPLGDGMEIGGDFYDVWEVSPGRWALALGDAAGTGPEAAALSALVRHTLRAVTMTETGPEDVVRTLNTALVEAVGEADGDAERFCTLIFGTVSTGEGVRVRLAGGGHPYPLVRRADGAVDEVPLPGTLLGLFGEVTVGSADVVLGPGDTLVAFTDGVVEARRDRRFFGVEGVRAILAGGVPGARAAAVALEDAVLAHSGGLLTDDVAAVVVHVPPASR